MIGGLIIKAYRETRLLTLLCGAGLAVFEGLVAWVFYIYQEELTGELTQIEFVQNLIQSLVGSELGGPLSPGALTSLAWVHPVVLALLLAHEITLCTRLPAGEIDRGTIDVLLSLPVSRWKTYVAETVVWLASGIVVMAFAVLGCYAGNLAVPPEARPPVERVLIVAANLYALYVSFGGMALLISACSDRRGRAVGTAFGLAVGHFLWNFLGQFWSVADRLSFLSFLDYHKPLPLLCDGVIPYADLTVLITAGSLLWLAGGIVFLRRDICTV